MRRVRRHDGGMDEWMKECGKEVKRDAENETDAGFLCHFCSCGQ